VFDKTRETPLVSQHVFASAGRFKLKHDMKRRIGNILACMLQNLQKQTNTNGYSPLHVYDISSKIGGSASSRKERTEEDDSGEGTEEDRAGEEREGLHLR